MKLSAALGSIDLGSSSARSPFSALGEEPGEMEVRRSFHIAEPGDKKWIWLFLGDFALVEVYSHYGTTRLTIHALEDFDRVDLEYGRNIHQVVVNSHKTGSGHPSFDWRVKDGKLAQELFGALARLTAGGGGAERAAVLD